MKFSDKIFIIPSIILGANFLYRLFDFAEIITRFPLDVTNDLTGYLPYLTFLKDYGYLENVPLWYNGFTLFNIYPPGWTFFTSPFYILTNNSLLSAFLSGIMLLILGGTAVYLLGKELKISTIKRIALFLLLFANPMSIGAIFKQGRLPALMAFVLLLYLFYLCLYFKDRKLNGKALFISLIFAILLLTHQAEAVLSAAFLLGLFLIKKGKEKIKVIAISLLGGLLSLIWILHFIKATQETGFLAFNFSHWLTNWDSFFWNNLAGAIISLSLFTVCILYYLQRKNKNDLLFLSPILLLNFLYITRLILYVPILKHIYPDPWQDFFIVVLCTLFIGLDFSQIKKKWKTILGVFLIILTLGTVTYNHLKTPYMEPWTQEAEEAVSLIPLLDQESHFIMFSEYSPQLYSRAIYSYAAIYYNVSSASGWDEVDKEFSYVTEFNTLYKEYLNTENCNTLKEFNTKFNTTEILANGHYCEIIPYCGLEKKAENGTTCILSFEESQ